MVSWTQGHRHLDEFEKTGIKSKLKRGIGPERQSVSARLWLGLNLRVLRMFSCGGYVVFHFEHHKKTCKISSRKESMRVSKYHTLRL